MQNPLAHATPLSYGDLPSSGQTPGAQFIDSAAVQTGNYLTGKDGIPRAVLMAGADPTNSGTATNDFLVPIANGTAILVDATASALRIRFKTTNGVAARRQRVSLGFAQAVASIAVNSNKGQLLGAAPAVAAPCTIDMLSDLEDVGEVDVTVTFSTAGAKDVSIQTSYTQLNASITIT